MVRSPAIFPHWAFRMLARVEILSPKTLTGSRGMPWRFLHGSVCWGVVQREYPSQSPCSELQARKPHLCVQDACGTLCIDSLIKLWLTYSKLHIFKVKILSFYVYCSEITTVVELVNTTFHLKICLCLFVIFPSPTSFPQATTHLLFVIID